MDKRQLIGVVSLYDVAKAVVESQNFENKLLKAYIRDWPEQEKRLLIYDRPASLRQSLQAIFSCVHSRLRTLFGAVEPQNSCFLLFY